MHRGGNTWSWGLALGLGVLSAGSTVEALAETASTRPVLITATVGSESVPETRRAQLQMAVRRALEAQGYRASVGQDLLGQAVIACQTPECIERALDAANADFAIVPALWDRSGDTELTLTLVRREGRNINAADALDENPEAAIEALVVQLLGNRKVAAAAEQEPTGEEPARSGAWIAGPVILIGAGAAALIAVGVGAATRSDTQQLNTAAVAAWSAVGAAAIAGGITWWVVGAKRRRGPRTVRHSAPAVALGPTSVDLRLRF